MQTRTRSSAWARPQWIISAGVVILILLLAVWVALGRGDNTPPPAPTGPVTTASAAQPAETSGDIPTSAPDTSWTLWYGIALPSSATAGPKQADGSGFAHTPTGALMAAAQIPYRAAIGDNWRSATDQQIVAGPGRDAYVAAMAAAPSHTDTSRVVQIAGFRFVSFTPDTSVIELVNGDPQKGLRTSTLTLRWVDGDWRLVAAPDGALGSKPNTVTSLAGYVSWKGVS